MRIAYLTADFGIPVFGNKGASIHVRELSLALQAAGDQVNILTPRPGGDAPAGFDIPVHEIPLDQADRFLVRALERDPDAGKAMAREIRSMAYAATLRHRLSEFLDRFQPDAIYERYSLLGTAGIDVARERGIPHLLEVNAPLSVEAATHRNVSFIQTVRSSEQRVLGASSHVIAVSGPVKEWIVSTGVDPDRVTVMPNGVNTERFDRALPAAQAGIDTGRPTVGFVGTLKAWHGTRALIHAVARLARGRGPERTPHLLIVGDGPQRDDLEHLAIAEGIAHLVTFTGTVSHDSIPSWIASMDVAVAPYDDLPDFYFSPLKLFEYMAGGRPIVASRIGQIADCIRDGETGLLYPPGDVLALANRIERLLDDHALAQKLGRAARSDAEANHGWHRHAKIVSALIERELAHRAEAALPLSMAREGG